MKLRTKTWTVVLAAMGALLGTTLLLGGRVVRASFAELEREQATRDARRVQAVLARQRDDLERTARDYAEWNDTIAYAEGRNPAFADVNLSADSIANLEVQLVLVFNAAGSPAGGVWLPPGASDLVAAAPVDFTNFAADVALILADPSAQTRVKGFRWIGDTPWMFAAAPLTTADSPPGPHGVYVVARELDSTFFADLSEIVQNPVSLHEPHDERAGEPPVEDWAHTLDPRIALALIGDDHLIAHFELPVSGGDPITLHVALDRPVHRQATRAGWLLVVQVAGTTLLLGALFTVLLGRLVVSRVEQLHDAVQQVRRDDDLGVRVPASGNDEIAGLGAAINTMFERLDHSRAERDQAHREREKLQAQLLQAQKMEAIGEFAGGIAHDFNNCLTSITGWLSLVRHDLPQDSAHQEHLGLALASAHHAAAVVNQLLVYSRQGKPTLAPVSLRELLGSSLQLLRSGLPRTIELQLTTTGDDDVVLADNTQIQQVVINLVKNAADAMQKKGRVTLMLDEINLPAPGCPGAGPLPPGRYARLTVRDTGPGIPAKLHDRIFEPFFTTKAAGRGTGLGLAVVRSVVARHRGAVGLASPAGEGAQFFVYLPLHHIEDVLTPAPPVGTPASGARVLVVDDDAGVRDIIARVITRHGYQVTTATDGEDAWEQFTHDGRTFDVVLTDLTMPRLGGLQLGERIFNSGKRVPVLLMTAYAATLDPEQLRRAGFAALVPKPLDLEGLKAEMAAALTRDPRPGA